MARLTEARGEAAIRRVNQRRAVTVSADVAQGESNAEEILASLSPLVRELEDQHPGVRIRFGGNKHEAAKSLGSLRRDFFIALGLVYFLLAGLFKSYVQPLIVLTAVPFGLIGAVAGHLLMGYPLTLLSVIGLVALTGIVVNDSLILVDFVNREIASGTPPRESVVAAGVRRLRPIMLTSLTTILGLAPLMTETSFQARFLIPLAISITFGLAFATLLTLIVVPSSYLILLDIRAMLRRLWHGPPTPEAATPADAV
ncbi:MAG: efflux RND transporter permease subunit [Planctomycetota bacterium]|nr:MAG: efflux RND transporter permease subunit [Planctomycetota bacterium]